MVGTIFVVVEVTGTGVSVTVLSGAVTVAGGGVTVVTAVLGGRVVVTVGGVTVVVMVSVTGEFDDLLLPQQKPTLRKQQFEPNGIF